MITKQDCLLLLSELRSRGVDTTAEIRKCVSSPTVDLETLKFIKKNNLNKFTHNKAISKIHDSYRVSKEDKEYLNTLGKDVNFYPGVKEWFDRINQYGKEHGAIIEHYIISSGIKPIINSTEIAKHFKAVYACDFYYDENGKAVWPKMAINFTGKTQYLYKIRKGILDETDQTEVNKKYKEKRIPFRNMIYIGDGLTDIPCMTMLKKEGGKSIGIYAPSQKKRVQQFLIDDRINYICPANYRENSYLDRTVKLIIKTACLVSELEALEEKQTTKAEETLLHKED